jgi:DNA topoisomerase-1
MMKVLFDAKTARSAIERGRRAKWWRRVGGKASGFRYVDSNGDRITDEVSLERIKSLVIPPAWKHVRISPAQSSAIQAVGMDTTGRIQYKYHAKFSDKQQRKKFGKLIQFGEHLPKLRKLTNEHIQLDGYPREKVLAVMLRLINSLYIRVGTEKSVRHYRTYGITTLKNKHLTFGRKGELIFEFVGKSHVQHRKVLVDKELAALLKEIKELGRAGKLFHYVDDDGRTRSIKPGDINRYLKQATAPEFSAKDFRTWGGTLLSAVALAEFGPAENEVQCKKCTVNAVKAVAEQLGNTPTVCRSSYIHPAVLKAYEKGVTLEHFTPRKKRLASRLETDHEPEEIALLNLLKKYS